MKNILNNLNNKIVEIAEKLQVPVTLIKVFIITLLVAVLAITGTIVKVQFFGDSNPVVEEGGSDKDVVEENTYEVLTKEVIPVLQGDKLDLSNYITGNYKSIDYSDVDTEKLGKSKVVVTLTFEDGSNEKVEFDIDVLEKTEEAKKEVQDSKEEAKDVKKDVEAKKDTTTGSGNKNNGGVVDKTKPGNGNGGNNGNSDNGSNNGGSTKPPVTKPPVKDPEDKPKPPVKPADPVKTQKDVPITHSIAFTTEYRDNANMEVGTEKVVQNGSEGVRTVTTRIYYTDGKETFREVLSDVVTKNAVNKIVERGTKPKVVTYSMTLSPTIWGVFTDVNAANAAAESFGSSNPSIVTWITVPITIKGSDGSSIGAIGVQFKHEDGHYITYRSAGTFKTTQSGSEWVVR